VITIRGEWRTRTVWIDGVRLSPTASQRVWNHSPDGFNWGYGGSGPAQLALAILLAAGVECDDAVRLHQRFKWDVIAPLPQASFEVDVDLVGWLARVRTERGVMTALERIVRVREMVDRLCLAIDRGEVTPSEEEMAGLGELVLEAGGPLAYELVVKLASRCAAGRDALKDIAN